MGYGHAGDARAQLEIGRCFLDGLGIERSPELAQQWLSLAAKAQRAPAQRLLGDSHFNGELGKPERAIAEEWYARAAAQGDAPAQDMLPGSWSRQTTGRQTMLKRANGRSRRLNRASHRP